MRQRVDNRLREASVVIHRAGQQIPAEEDREADGGFFDVHICLLLFFTVPFAWGHFPPGGQFPSEVKKDTFGYTFRGLTYDILYYINPMANVITFRSRRHKRELRAAWGNVSEKLNELIERELHRAPGDWRDILKRAQPKVSAADFQRCLAPE